MEQHWSITDWERWLLATEGWWHDPRWGVRKDRKSFRRWAKAHWRAAKDRKKQRKGYAPARDYNLALKDARRRPTC